MKLAFLKAPLPGPHYALAHKIGTTLDRFRYSHSQVLFSDGLSGSCWSKTGVAIRDMPYDKHIWDFFDLPKANEEATRAFYEKERGTPYDNLGMLRFGLGILKESPTKYFCHEVFAASQGWEDAWRYGPWLLYQRAHIHLGAKLVEETAV